MGLLFPVKPGLDIEHHLKEKEQNLKKMGLSLQPHVVVCEDLDKLDAVGGSSAYAMQLCRVTCSTRWRQLLLQLMSV